jgi:ABC-2 type transport system ATP-binding protein
VPARPRRCGCCFISSQPTAGTALVFGRRYQDLERPAARVGAVLEAADFHPGTLRAAITSSPLALALGEDGSGIVPRARADAASARRDAVCASGRALGAAARRRVGGYSLGMRQRLGLAGRIARRPGAC